MPSFTDFLNGLKPETWANINRVVGTGIGAIATQCEAPACESKGIVSCHACGIRMCLDHGAVRVPSPARPIPEAVCCSCFAKLWGAEEEAPPRRKKRSGARYGQRIR